MLLLSCMQNLSHQKRLDGGEDVEEININAHRGRDSMGTMARSERWPCGACRHARHVRPGRGSRDSTAAWPACAHTGDRPAREARTTGQ
jgi:hypothetical protein